MNLDAVDKQFVASLIPENAIPTGLMSVVTWLNPDDGRMQYRVYMDADLSVANALGFMELAKADVLSRAFGGMLPNTAGVLVDEDGEAA
jgi:hypothetical protein